MAPAVSSMRTEQEEKLDTIFSSLEATFKKVDRCKDDAKIQAMLKEITNKLKDAKTLIKEFEREARTDGMPARDLADRKRNLVNELNNYIAMKKSYSTTEDNRGALLAGAAPPEVDMGNDGKTVQELMVDGRKQMQETEQTLNRAEKIVEDTVAIGQQTAATLHDQTNQLNKVVDDLNEIEFTMKKASKVIADITKGLMTDRCISCLLLLVVLGVIALVIVKVINPNKKAISQAANAAVDAANITVNTSGIFDNTIGAITGRRLAARMLFGALAGGLDGDGTPFEMLG